MKSKPLKTNLNRKRDVTTITSAPVAEFTPSYEDMRRMVDALNKEILSERYKLMFPDRIVQDRRRYQPLRTGTTKDNPAREWSGNLAHLELARRKKKVDLFYHKPGFWRRNYTRLAFSKPDHVPICWRRKARRAALFALATIENKAGLGGARKRYRQFRFIMRRLGRYPKRRNEYSDVRC